LRIDSFNHFAKFSKGKSLTLKESPFVVIVIYKSK